MIVSCSLSAKSKKLGRVSLFKKIQASAPKHFHTVPNLDHTLHLKHFSLSCPYDKTDYCYENIRRATAPFSSFLHTFRPTSRDGQHHRFQHLHWQWMLIAQVWMPVVLSNTHQHITTKPQKKTILHELNSASRFPMLLKPYCTQGFREPWYRRVHSAQLRPAVQPLQTAIVESLHGHWVSERLYLVFSQQFSPVTGGLNIRPSDTGKGPWQLYPPLSLVAKVTLDLDNDVILFCMSGI